jgi:hypothetical protein
MPSARAALGVYGRCTQVGSADKAEDSKREEISFAISAVNTVMQCADLLKLESLERDVPMIDLAYRLVVVDRSLVFQARAGVASTASGVQRKGEA